MMMRRSCLLFHVAVTSREVLFAGITADPHRHLDYPTRGWNAAACFVSK